MPIKFQQKHFHRLYLAGPITGVPDYKERFRLADGDKVRIITKGGDIVNAIPDTVTMECYVRGATMEDIVMVNKKVNRAFAGAAAAMGAQVALWDNLFFLTFLAEYAPAKERRSAQKFI